MQVGETSNIETTVHITYLLLLSLSLKMMIKRTIVKFVQRKQQAARARKE
jgi:hypothetical protein